MSTCCQRVRRWCFPRSFTAELKAQIKLSIPIVSLTILQYLIMTTATIFCGRMGKVEIDAVSLATSLNNALVITSSLGLVEGYETLFTQAYGSENKKLMGIYLQRSTLLHLLAFMVCFAILINAEGFCILLGQDREISYLTGQYLLRYTPGAFGLFFFTLFSRYLQDMNQVLPTIVIVVIGNIVNISAHFLFINGLGFKTDGSAFAVSIANLTMLSLIVAYICCSKKFETTWPGLSVEMWRGWGKVMKLGVAALLSTCFEWWAFEIGVFLTGLLGTTELGAQTIGMNIDALAFNILVGIGITSTIRVGQHLGAGDALAAKTACYTTFVYNFVPMVIIVILIAALNTELPKIFTDIPDIQALTSKILPVIALYTLMTGFTTWTSGVFRGSGRQHIAALCFFLSYYVLGLPIAISLMFFTPLRTLGFWVSLVGTLTTISVVMTILVLRTDWDQQVRKANKNTALPGGEEEKQALLKSGDAETVSCTADGATSHKTYSSFDDHIKWINQNDKQPDDNVENTKGAVASAKSDEIEKSHHGAVASPTNDDKTIVKGYSVTSSKNSNSMTSLVLARMSVIIVIFMILAAGILIRIFVPLPPLPDYPLTSNTTLTSVAPYTFT